MLEIFANQHFLPTHPLRHHPLWLDENDFHQNHFIAKVNNIPHPFKIDPYAHHSQLSPYAAKGKRKSKTTKKERNLEEEPSTDITTDTTINMNKKHNREQSTSSALLSSKNVSKEQYKIPICVGTVYPRIYYYNLEQMYIRVGSNNINDNNWNFNTLSMLQNINYFPQSFIAQESNSLTENSKKDINDCDYTERDDLNACKTLSAIEEASERRLERLKQDNMYSPLIEEGMKLLRSIYPTPSYFKGALSVLSGKRYSYELGLELEKAALKEGYRSPWWGTMKQWSKVGATVLPGEQSHDVPFKRNTKLVHISLLSNADEVLQSSYISASKGYLRYIYSFEADNLNADSVDLLNNLMQSSRLPSNSSDDFIDDENNYTGMYNGQYKLEETQTPTNIKKKLFLQAIKQDIKQHNYKIPLYFSPKYMEKHNLELREDAQGVNVSPFDIIRTFIGKDINTTITSDDNNELLINALALQYHSDFDLRQPKMELPRLAAERDKDFIDSSSSPLENSQKEQIWESKRKQIKDNKSNVVLDSVNNILSHAHTSKLAQQAKPAVEVQHYYHLSQVRFPETFMLPAEVLAAELSNPFVPLHGLTGQALAFKELQVDNLTNTMPEVAAVISQRPQYTHFRGNSSHEMRTKHKNASDNDVHDNSSLSTNTLSTSEANKVDEFSPEEIDEFVIRNRSPTQHHGRHLWFTAKDILEHNGLVDVNATPVEVLVRTTHSTSETPVCLLEGNKQKDGDDSVADDRDDDQIDLMNRKTTPLHSHMYNVACLTHPEHALKLINNYYQEEKYESEEYLAFQEL